MSLEKRSSPIPERSFSLTYSREKRKVLESEATLEQVKELFLAKAFVYEELRQRLRVVEQHIMNDTEDRTLLVQHTQTRQEILEEIKELKEEFLPMVARTEDLLGEGKAMETLKEWMIERAGGKRYLNDWTAFAAQMREASLEMLYNTTVSLLEGEGPTRTASPYEAILSTIELRKIGRDTADLIKEQAVAVCQSGSASWGGYISTRGQIKDDPLGISQRELRDMKLISDVDMIVVIDAIDQAQKIIQILVDERRIEKHELTRIEKFKEIFENGDADLFSMRGHFKKVEQSYHFISRQVIEQLTDPARAASERIPILRDFRPDKPGSFKKYGGYPILGLEGSQIALLKKEPATVDDQNESLGYISESPAGGPVLIDIGGTVERHYALGLISTQLLYMPDILHDSDNFLRTQTDRLFLSIAPYLPQKHKFNVPRWERMPKTFKDKLVGALYSSQKHDLLDKVA